MDKFYGAIARAVIHNDNLYRTISVALPLQGVQAFLQKSLAIEDNDDDRT